MIRKLIKSNLIKNWLARAFASAFLVLSVALLSGALILTLDVFGVRSLPTRRTCCSSPMV